MNELPLIQIVRHYPKKDLLKAILTGKLFFLIYGGITVTPLIMISMLYVPFMTTFLLLIYVSLSLSFNYGLKQSVSALKHYDSNPSFDFDTVTRRTTVVFAIVVFIVLSIIYLQFLQ